MGFYTDETRDIPFVQGTWGIARCCNARTCFQWRRNKGATKSNVYILFVQGRKMYMTTGYNTVRMN